MKIVCTPKENGRDDCLNEQREKEVGTHLTQKLQNNKPQRVKVGQLANILSIRTI
jgi:predicted unusual protein kinase regulating ubiquinone biosynthesis (AarF/ABC1/UbiB family)